MEGFNYDLFNKSFKDILIELCNDPSSKGIECTIKHYKKELDSKKIKKINKTFWKIQNRITINLNLLLFKAFLLFSMIAWILDNMINYPGDYGPFGANYFNICAVVLLGIDVWERRKDLFFLRNLDEIEMNDKKE
jgi:polyferredoxin